MDPFLITYIKIYSKHNIDLNVQDETIKLFEENTEVSLYDLGLGKPFLATTQKEQKEKKR